MSTKEEATAQVRSAKARLGLTWAQLAEAVGRPVGPQPAMALRCAGWLLADGVGGGVP
jgi:hypothetical protein